MKLLIRNYLQQKEEAPSKVGLGLKWTESQLKEKPKHFYSNARQGVKRMKRKRLLSRV